MHAIVKLVSSRLKPLSQQVSTFLRDSDHLIQKPQELGEIQHIGYLFTADAVAMYPNIDA